MPIQCSSSQVFKSTSLELFIMKITTLHHEFVVHLFEELFVCIYIYSLTFMQYDKQIAHLHYEKLCI